MASKSSTITHKRAAPDQLLNVHPEEVLREELLKPVGISAYNTFAAFQRFGHPLGSYWRCDDRVGNIENQLIGAVRTAYSGLQSTTAMPGPCPRTDDSEKGAYFQITLADITV